LRIRRRIAMSHHIDDDALRALLSLEPKDRLEELSRTDAIDSGVGHGAAMPVALPERPDLELLFDRAGPFTDIVTELGDFGRVKRGGREDTLFLLESNRAPHFIEGAVHQVDEMAWALDTSNTQTIVLLHDDGSELVLAGAGGNLRCLRLLRGGATDETWSDGLSRFEPPEEPELEIPAPESLLAGFDVPTWFLARARLLYRSADILERVASVGFVARLGAAVAASPAEVFAGLLTGRATSPSARARQWAGGVSAAMTEELSRMLLESAGVLFDDLESLEEVVVEGGEPTTRAARALCYRRDELESVAWVLRAAGGREALGRTSLEALDAEASRHLSALDLSLDGDDDLLSTLAAQEPDRWWGASRGS
jgi:hypothetical protein